MTNSTSIEDDIDLFALLEILWARKAIVIFVTTVFFCIAVLYFFLLKEKQFVTTTIAIAPDAASIDSYHLNIKSDYMLGDSPNEILASTDTLGISPQIWLQRLDHEIKNPKLLYEALQWARDPSNAAFDWRQEKQNTNDEQVNYEDFRNRISTRIENQELKLLFVTDNIDTGLLISKHILKTAQAETFRKLQANYLQLLARYFEATNLRVAETWYTLSALNKNPPDILSDYNSTKLTNLATDLGVLSGTLKEAAEKTLRGTLVKPVSSITELSIILPSFSADKSLGSNVFKHIASSTIAGFIIGILAALVSNGFEQRYRSKQIASER